MGVTRVLKAYSIEEILDVMEKYGEKVELLAGGTDLLVDIRAGKNKGSVIIDISDVKEMKKIEIGEDDIVLGALTTFTDIAENDYLKENVTGLWKAAKSVGSPQIRNMGTVGGNICNGSPAADIVPPLLVLDAKLNIKSRSKQRKIKLKEFYMENGSRNLRSDELLYSISFTKSRDKNIRIGFEKLGLRNALAISRISCSVYAIIGENNRIENIRIASGALGKYPLREYALEKFLKDKNLNDGLIEEAAEIFSHEVKQRLSGRSSCPYKKEAVKGIFKKAISFEGE
jgi:carbon-monoxide dehydrogenase medium subunit/xanthine dehydrogenase FAD-binding subunit